MRNFFSLLAVGLPALTLAAQTAAAQPPAPMREAGLYATFNTTMGAITLKLYEVESPITVRNFVYLAQGRKSWKDPKTGQMVRRPLYNGLTFFRVIPQFMIQGGDPAGNGTGDVGFTIKDEFSPGLKFDGPGRLAMANAGPGTGSCQFFITEVPTTYLNGLHTIFGQVVDGQDVVNKIARVPTKNETPVTPVRITTITFTREGPPPPGDVLARPAVQKAAPKQ